MIGAAHAPQHTDKATLYANPATATVMETLASHTSKAIPYAHQRLITIMAAVAVSTAGSTYLVAW